MGPRCLSARNNNYWIVVGAWGCVVERLVAFARGYFDTNRVRLAAINVLAACWLAPRTQFAFDIRHGTVAGVMGVVIGTCVPAADEGPVLEEEEDDDDAAEDHQQLQALQTLQLRTFRLVADSRFLCGWKIEIEIHLCVCVCERERAALYAPALSTFHRALCSRFFNALHFFNRVVCYDTRINCVTLCTQKRPSCISVINFFTFKLVGSFYKCYTFI
jgi:hypothetical protein